ncbi:substrate-binding periplasmic protein [Pseudomonas cremoricolorata]|uniref:Amino acid ABC transporter substrate-binding protein n=1 Tax=Pseudomonas cremoricolorata TaxID=157783 RepID=A0A089Y954_9PSED|nr:transporter substrate-binding domain-containing protein [Pseudomonas cremoricolorata]AIR88378.1 amino acid ABC transporter substrate-binding protein [Pseudomonas cremoricolorata]
MSKILPLIGIVLLICLSPLAQAERLRIVSDDWAPYIYQDNGQPQGLHFEVASEVFKRLGVEVDWVFMPWKRCLAMVEQGQADGILGLFKLPEREAFVLFPHEPLSQVDFILFQSRARPHSVRTLDDLNGLTVGTSPGYNYSAEFNEAQGFRREPAPTHIANFGKLALGRIDLLVTDRHVGEYLLHKLHLDEQIEALPLLIDSKPQYLGLTRKPGREQLAQAFAEVLQHFKQEPAYEAIVQRYVGTPDTFPRTVEHHERSTR